MRKYNFKKPKSLPAGLPGEILPKVPKVTVKGDGTVIIENHGGLMCLGEKSMEIARRGGFIRINGKDLKLLCMNPDTIIVQGDVSSVELA